MTTFPTALFILWGVFLVLGAATLVFGAIDLHHPAKDPSQERLAGGQPGQHSNSKQLHPAFWLGNFFTQFACLNMGIFLVLLGVEQPTFALVPAAMGTLTISVDGAAAWWCLRRFRARVVGRVS
jgi:hypothetical protein